MHLDSENVLNVSVCMCVSVPTMASEGENDGDSSTDVDKLNWKRECTAYELAHEKESTV